MQVEVRHRFQTLTDGILDVRRICRLSMKGNDNEPDRKSERYEKGEEDHEQN